MLVKFTLNLAAADVECIAFVRFVLIVAARSVVRNTRRQISVVQS